MQKLFTSALLAITIVAFGCFTNSAQSTSVNIPQSLTAITSVAKAEAAPTGIEVGQAAPDFTFTDLTTGNTVKLSGLRDKPVFINFWATWCPPCVKELPHIQTKYEQYKDKINFLAISLDGEQEAPAQFISAKGYTFPVGYGNEREISRAYNVQAIPMSFIIDTNGVIKAKIIGSMDEAALESFIQKGL